MRDPRPGQWGALERCAARPRARSCGECEAQTATTAEALTRRSSPTRQRGGCGAQQRPERAGPDLSSRATASPSPAPPPERAGAERPPPAGSGKRGKPASALTAGARTGRGRRGPDSGGSGCRPPSTPWPAGARASPPRTTVPSRAAPQSGAAGHPPGSPLRSGRGASGRPAPAQGCRTAAVAGGAGTTFRRSSAPRPLSSHGGTLRAAPVAAGYRGHCATYKSSLCGAILSLSVCGSCASAALETARGGGDGGRSEEQLQSPPSRHRRPRTVGLQRREEPVPLRCLGTPFLTLPGLPPLPLRSQTSSRARGPGGGWEPGPARRGGPGWGAGGAGWGRRGGGGGGPRPGGGGRRPGPGSGRAAPRGPGGAAGGEGATRGRVQELDGWRGQARGRLWFPSAAPAAAEFGGGTLRLGMLRAGVGGGVGWGRGWGAPPSQPQRGVGVRTLGLGRHPGPICRVDRAGRLSVQISSFVLKDKLREFLRELFFVFNATLM